ncbi:MAG: glycerol-3-phosphate acyltransferase [Alphaproteobacteria bacterium 64-6]|nr:glycerol-3-phosphate 1-O-acyltransferase PlsY [Hyphomicrobium sp.]MBN9263603.1 glycerol-3-phosphate 1-O-acyltransferase PlsY [Hyphomicrobium sp.]OJU25500.1 MAG: glycerol-3-phosphate acyltransferase [Alphaproteobacteria bacterium 64-6]
MSSSLILPALAALALGYLLGSIPFGLILTRAAGLGDVREIGSKSIGATNVLRTGNKKLAALTLLFDGLKGTVAVVLAAWIAASYGVSSGQGTSGLLGVLLVPWVAGLGAVIGHLFPVWLSFKGGKGIATYIGVLLGAYWPAALVFCAAWLAVAVVTRYSSLSSLVGTFVVFIYFTVVGGQLVVPIVAIISALIFWKHRENIRRLLAGEESRIGAKG